MGAKQKLNAAHLNGALLVAGLAGLLTGSWPVFLVAFAALVAGDHLAGNIRR